MNEEKVADLDIQSRLVVDCRKFNDRMSKTCCDSIRTSRKYKECETCFTKNSPYITTGDFISEPSEIKSDASITESKQESAKSSDNKKPKQNRKIDNCLKCKRRRPIIARGLCGTCYSIENKAGKIGKYPNGRQKQGNERSQNVQTIEGPDKTGLRERSSEFFKDLKGKREQEKLTQDIDDSYTIRINFADKQYMFKALYKSAEREIRTPENQALYYIKKGLQKDHLLTEE